MAAPRSPSNISPDTPPACRARPRRSSRTSGLPSSRAATLYGDLDEDAVLEALTGQRLRRAPGTGPAAYSNFGAGLLGIALRRVTGAGSYAELAEQTVLRPLGLSDTVVDPSPEQKVRLAQGSRAVRPTGRRLVPGGSRRSGRPALHRARSAQLPGSPAGSGLDPAGHGHPTDPRAVAARPPTHDRAGLDAHPATGGDLWWHDGGTGGFRSFAGFSPERGRAVAILVNEMRGPDRVAIDLMDLRRVSSGG